jgi:radical S-adenosyl methionine domain-containing protein 2
MKCFKHEQGLAINWHMTERCNYNCRFCFSRYGNAKELCNNLGKSKYMILKLWKYNFKKITFTGGEPLLCKNLGELIKYANHLGMATSIVTNGYYITEKVGKEFLKKYSQYIDWIGISLDSGREDIELQLGRGYGDHVERVRNAVKLIRQKYPHIKIKINTTVTKLNWQEDMHDIINYLSPDRWKVFQVKIIEGVNDHASDLKITKEEFYSFINRHKDLNPIWEDNDLMTNSYLMIDPFGRFYEGGERIRNKRPSIMYASIENAMKDLNFDFEKFCQRGGYYKWKTKFV